MFLGAAKRMNGWVHPSLILSLSLSFSVSLSLFLCLSLSLSLSISYKQNESINPLGVYITLSGPKILIQSVW